MLLVLDLGLSSLVIVVFTVVLSLAGLGIQAQWRRSAARKEEVKRLMILASEEATRAEFEASFSYGSAVTAAPQAQCAVCFFPTTRKCSRCKVVHYCSGRCQIIHWRKGHVDECHPPEARSDLDWKAGEHAQNVNYINSFDNGGALHSAPPREIHSEAIQADVECFGEEVSHVKHDNVKVDFSAECSSISSGASFSGFSGSSANNETSDDSSKSDGCESDDTENDKLKTSFIAKDEQQPKILTPKFASLVDSVYLSSDKRAQDKSTVIFSNGHPYDNSTVEPSVTSHGFCENALGPRELANGHHASFPKNCEDKNLPGSTLQFSFNSSRSNSRGEEMFHDTIPAKPCKSVSTLGRKLDKDAVLSSLSLNSKKLDDSSLDRSNDSAVKRSAETQSSGRLDSTSSSTKMALPRADSSLASTFPRPLDTSVRLRKSVKTEPAGAVSAQAGMGPGESVVDQLKGSLMSIQYSLRGTDSVGKYDMGLFSYETFVKLYTWKEVELRPCGLINCGNSCYANAVLQCLAFTPPLTAFFLQGLHSKSCTKKDWCFMCQFEGLLQKAKRGESPVSPLGIVSQLEKIGSQLSKGREEDAHEFLRYTVDAMESICLAEHGTVSDPSEADTNLMGLTFGGYLQSKIRCNKCQGKTERHERMMDLTVEIEGSVESLEEALQQFTVYETLDGENKYKCSRCGSYEKAKKKLTVLEAPNVLTIALKRFQTGYYGKLNKPIRFPEILDLAPYMSGTSDKSPIYRLYGVIVHLDIMNAAFSGHYICYIKNPQNKWFKIDDSQVTPVDKGSVLAAKAYTLLYSRCSPRAPRSIRNKILSTESKHRPTPSRTISKLATSNPRSSSSSDGLPSMESYSKYQQFKRAFEEDSSSSDNSSLFSSNSDEGSTSTDMTRASTCTDDLSEYLFNHNWTSPSQNPNGSEASLGGEGTMPFLHSDMTKHHSRKLANSSSSSGSFSSREADDSDKLANGVKSGKTKCL